MPNPVLAAKIYRLRQRLLDIERFEERMSNSWRNTIATMLDDALKDLTIETDLARETLGDL